ncbi:MAG: right-handed parallel beta-helix repeat-containing protein [Myxococcales bacterium]|nr:right-handed parallel beta-helix repeat-containing protein [Myxococcales bacterium]
MLASLLSVSSALAATWTVGVNGDFATVQDAVQAAQQGDVVELAEGDYPVALTLDKQLTLRGQGPGKTRLVPFDQGDDTMLGISSVFVVTLTDLTLDGRSTQRLIDSVYSTLEVSNVSFEGGLDVASGGHVRFVGGHLTLRDATFPSRSTSERGSQLFVESADVLIEDSLFRNGHGTSRGGAVYLRDTTAVIRRTRFEDSQAVYGGGLGTKDSHVTIEDCHFERNEVTDPDGAGGYGGGLSVRGGTVHVVRSTFVRNRSEVGGGALDLSFTWSSRIEDSVFEENSSTADGGAFFGSENVDLRLWRNRFVDNEAEGTGGTVLLGGEGTFDVAGNQVCGSSAMDGGAIGVSGWSGALSGTIRNNVMVDVMGFESGAAVLSWASQLAVTQNTLVATAGPSGVYFNAETRAVLSNNILATHEEGVAVWGTSAESVDASWNLYWDVPVLFGGKASEEGVMQEDPRFVDESDCSAFRTMAEGPVVDGGHPEVFDDDGTVSDLGAYGGPGASLLHDLDADGVIVGDCDPFDGTRSAAADCDQVTQPTDAPGKPTTSDDSGEHAPRSWFCGPTGGAGTFAGLAVVLLVRRRRVEPRTRRLL